MRVFRIILAFFGFWVSQIVVAQSPDPTFKANISFFGVLGYNVAIQPDNKPIIVGDKVIRLNTDGSLDNTFTSQEPANTQTIGKTLLLQADGKIILGGSYYMLYSGYKGLVRLNSNGSLDNSYQPSLPFQWATAAASLQPDGKLVIAYGRQNSITGTEYGLKRFNPDGSIDNSFTSNFITNQRISSMTIQTNGQILIAGYSYPIGGGSLLKRFNSDGSEDLTFNAKVSVTGGSNPYINKISYHDGIGIVISGYFTKCNNTARQGIALLADNGDLDNTFVAGITMGNILSHVYLGSGEFLFGGLVQPDVNTWNSVAFIKLNTLGELDLLENLNRGHGSSFFGGAFALDNNGRVIMSPSPMVVDGIACLGVIRLNQNLTLDQSFITIGEGGALVSTVAVQSDMKIIIGGDFNYVDGKRRNKIARLNPNGSIDLSFNPGTGFDGTIYKVLIQVDGKILVAGSFSYFNQTHVENLARLNPDGSLDNSFNADFSFKPYETSVSACYGLAQQADGKIIVKSRLYPEYYTRITRLNMDGSVDIVFNHPIIWGYDRMSSGRNLIDLATRAPIFVLPDGKVISENLRFNTNGQVDPAYQPNPNTFFMGLTHDGKYIVRNFYDYTYGPLNRLNPDGTVDRPLSGELINYDITSLFIQPDNKVVVSASPSSVYNPNDYFVRRVNVDGTKDNSFNEQNLIPGRRFALISQAPDLLLAAGYPDYLNHVIQDPLVRINVNFKSSQTIQFPSIGNVTYNDNPITFSLNATATSGLPVTYQVVSGSALMAANMLTVQGTGKIVIRAIQSGDSQFEPAQSVDREFYSKRNQVITFSGISDVTYQQNLTINLGASSSSGLNVNFGVTAGQASINETLLQVQSPGRVSVSASQDGNELFNAALEIVQSFCALPTKPIITLDNNSLSSSTPVGNEWFKDGQLMANSSQSIDFVEAGTYSVRTNIDGCISESSDVIVITELDSNSIQQYSIYPNPAADEFIIKFEGDSNISIKMIDIYGREVFRADECGNDELRVDSRLFARGLYFIHINGLRIQNVKVILN